MTFHRYRHKPAKGYRSWSIGEGSTGVMVRLDNESFSRLRAIAERRRVPLAAVVREVMADWLLRGPAFEEERQP